MSKIITQRDGTALCCAECDGQYESLVRIGGVDLCRSCIAVADWQLRRECAKALEAWPPRRAIMLDATATMKDTHR